MKKSFFFFICVCFLSCLYAQSKYKVTLIPLKVNKMGEESKDLEQDREHAYEMVKQYLKYRCRFFDEKNSLQRVRDFFRRHPNLDPTDQANMLKALEVPTTLRIMLKCHVKSIPDSIIPFMVWHKAYMHLEVVDKYGKNEIFASIQGENDKNILVPTKGRDFRRWKSNRNSRNRAIKDLAAKLIPKLLAEMDKNQQAIASFNLRAIGLTSQSKRELRKILESSYWSYRGIRIRDIQKGSNEGITAKVYCPQKISGFIAQIMLKFAATKELAHFVCTPDGHSVEIHRKADKMQKSKEKFIGRVVISLEPKFKNIVAKNPQALENQEILKDKLQEHLQGRFTIYDANQLWKNLATERVQMRALAHTNPEDFLRQKFHLATHAIYFWVKTDFRQVADVGRYCFAEISVRMLHLLSGEVVGKFRITSEEAFGRGVMVRRTEYQARREAISKLALKASVLLDKKLSQQNSASFRSPIPSINLKIEGFNNEEIEQLKGLIVTMEQDGKIKIDRSIESGYGYLRCDITFPKKTTLTQNSFAEKFKELCDHEAGLTISIRSLGNRLQVVKAIQEEDE